MLQQNQTTFDSKNDDRQGSEIFEAVNMFEQLFSLMIWKEVRLMINLGVQRSLVSIFLVNLEKVSNITLIESFRKLFCT